MSRGIAIGIDLGGTLVRVGAFDRDGHLLSQRTVGIASTGPEQGLRLIERTVRSALESIDTPALLGIGIGCAGPVDTVRGLIHNPYTLPGWDHVPVVEHLSRSFDVPVLLENDADAAALGEYWQGAGSGAKRLYAVTIGTGVGTALLIDGRVYRGLDGSHPEGGHQLIARDGPECYCGHRGCWESLVSGPAIAGRARRATNNQRILDLASGDPLGIEARFVAEAARAGDATAAAIMREVAHDVAVGIINIVSLFLPDVLVLGGGVMNSADLFLPTMQAMLEASRPLVPVERLQVLAARLGASAGMYGGAYAVLSKIL